MSSKRRFLQYWAPVGGRCLRVSYPVATAVGWLAWQTQPRLRRMLVRNALPFCGGDLRRAKAAAKAAYKNVARYWVDLASTPHRDFTRFEQEHLTLVGSEHLAPLAAPGPVMIVSAHLGNPELCLQALTARGRAFHALVEDIEPADFAAEILRLRSAGGGHFHEATLGGVKACLRALKDGAVVGLLADRDLQGTGICVELAGRTAKVARGPWEIARRSRATVIPAFARRLRDDHFSVSVEEPFIVPDSGDLECDVRWAAQRFAHLMEAHIRADPGQWTPFEDFWRVHRCG
ncbi:MAG: lysophospholipid acyltransferase family protein [Dehalococcoidia bacterium]